MHAGRCIVAVSLFLALGASHGSAAGATHAASLLSATVNLGPLTPSLDPATLAWIACVLILTLKLQTRPLFCLHNLDALALAATCLLLPLRTVDDPIGFLPTGTSWREGAYLLLSASAAYWLVRGVHLVLARSAPAITPNVREGSLSVLIVAGLAVACYTIATAPISRGSVDGLVGGVCLVETGKLPYGDAPGYDTRSPLLYAVHAGAVKLLPPSADVEEGAHPAALMWSTRDRWLSREWWKDGDFAASRAVNAALFLLTFAALAGIGHRHHSIAVGQAVAALFCVFPGTVECVAQPEIMLPTMLLTWSIAALRVPGAGGLLSGLCVTLAGVASPWAFLAIPVLLAYFLRTGWNGLGAMIGVVVGIAGSGVGIAVFTAPSLPRSDGALRAAGIGARFAARSDADKIVIEPATSAPVAADWKAPLWAFLLQGDTAAFLPDGDAARYVTPAGEPVRYRELHASPEVRGDLQRGYRSALAGLPPETRLWPALRTVLESTWLPAAPRPPAIAPVWNVWTGSDADAESRIVLARRISKGVLGLLTVFVALMLFRGGPARPHQVLGGMLALCAGSLLASEAGAVANWVWLAPTALAATAACSRGDDAPSEPVDDDADAERVKARLGERITVNT